jgi:hypothetical protein
VSVEDDLVAMLAAIAERDDGSSLIDSAGLAGHLGWSDAQTASALAAAKDDHLIWGIRIGGLPAPRFEDIELTVQGRRRLRAAARPGQPAE